MLCDSMHVMRFACVGALALAVGCSSSGETVSEPAELKNIRDADSELVVKWDEQFSSGSSESVTEFRIAYQGSDAYFAGVDGGLTAVNLDDGTERWALETDYKIVSGPVVVSGKVYVGTTNAELIAFSAVDGKQLWVSPLLSEVLTPVAATSEIVVVRTSDGKVFGLSANDGKRLWNFDRRIPSLTLRGGSAPLISGSVVYIGLDNGRVAAVNLEDGNVRWEQVIAAPNGRSELEQVADIDAELLLQDGVLYAASFGGEVAALSQTTGRVLWKQALSSHSGFAVWRDRVFVTDRDGTVWALSRDSGEEVWKQDALSYRQLGAPVIYQTRLAVSDLEGYIHFLDLQDGSIRGRQRIHGDIISSPLVVRGNELIALSESGSAALMYPAQPVEKEAERRSGFSWWPFGKDQSEDSDPEASETELSPRGRR